jgi:hypothetical protein
MRTRARLSAQFVGAIRRYSPKPLQTIFAWAVFFTGVTGLGIAGWLVGQSVWVAGTVISLALLSVLTLASFRMWATFEGARLTSPETLRALLNREIQRGSELAEEFAPDAVQDDWQPRALEYFHGVHGLLQRHAPAWAPDLLKYDDQYMNAALARYDVQLQRWMSRPLDERRRYQAPRPNTGGAIARATVDALRDIYKGLEL